MEEIKLGRYRHFKGGIYMLIAIARDSENPERLLAVYRTESEPIQYWVRPLAMWSETVLRDGYSGLRFEFIGD